MACNMGHYSLQYIFSVLVNSQGRSRNWKVYFFHESRWIWPQGQHHNKPSTYVLHSFYRKMVPDDAHILHMDLGLFICPFFPVTQVI